MISDDQNLVPEESQKGPESETEAEAPKPKGRDWTPIDLSKGTIKKGIFGDRRSFKEHVRKDLKTDLGSVLNASQREEISDELAGLRQKGLRSWEVKKKLNQMVEEGKLSKFEAKKLRREFGVKKSSLF